MNTVLHVGSWALGRGKNLAAAYREIIGGEVLENPVFGGTACLKDTRLSLRSARSYATQSPVRMSEKFK